MKIIRKIKRVYDWIIKCIQYSILLWNDFDWDYKFVLQLLKYKLKRTRECIVSNDIVVAAPKIGKQIRICELLIQRIMDDDYCKKEREEHDKKWGKLKFGTNPYFKNGSQIYRDKVRNEEDRKKESKEHLKIMNKEAKLIKYDQELLYKIFYKHLLSWWE